MARYCVFVIFIIFIAKTSISVVFDADHADAWLRHGKRQARTTADAHGAIDIERHIDGGPMAIGCHARTPACIRSQSSIFYLLNVSDQRLGRGHPGANFRLCLGLWDTCPKTGTERCTTTAGGQVSHKPQGRKPRCRTLKDLLRVLLLVP